MAIDYTSAIGRIRAAIPDVSDDPILTDPQIQALLDLSGDNEHYAIAACMRTIANETTLLYKAVKTDDLVVDGPAMAETLLKNAEKYEKMGAQDGGYFELVDSGFTMEDSWGSLGLI